jgi:hypothetical protein
VPDVPRSDGHNLDGRKDFDNPSDTVAVISLIDDAATRAFAVTLILSSTKEILGDHPVSERLSEAIAALDIQIRNLRTVAFYMNPG